MDGGLDVDAAAVLAWRLRRHGLAPRDGARVGEVADRVLALRGWPAPTAATSVALRLASPDPEALDRALETGEVIRSYALRGAATVFTPGTGALLLAVRTTTRVWTTARYQQQGGFAVADWQPLRAAVRELLAGGPATRAEIGAHLARSRATRELATAAATGAGADSLLKPLHWWGDICFGPVRGQQATFRLLADDAGWPGPLDVDEAGPLAVERYLAASGAASRESLHSWFTEGLSVPRQRLEAWIAALDDVVVRVEVGGRPAYALAEDLDALTAAEPCDVVRLLPAFDPWVLVPGTGEATLVAPGRRGLVSRGADLVTRGGVVTGTWRSVRGTVAVSWFDEAGEAPTDDLAAEVRLLGELRGQELGLALERVPPV